MRDRELTLRCLAEQDAPGVWVVLCLDFDLAAQGDSLEDAKARLEVLLTEYVEDAMTGPDRDHALTLLNRRSPWRYWLRYYWLMLMERWRGVREPRRWFQETLPLTVAR